MLSFYDCLALFIVCFTIIALFGGDQAATTTTTVFTTVLTTFTTSLTTTTTTLTTALGTTTTIITNAFATIYSTSTTTTIQFLEFVVENILQTMCILYSVALFFALYYHNAICGEIASNISQPILNAADRVWIVLSNPQNMLSYCLVSMLLQATPTLLGAMTAAVMKAQKLA
jgi:hypothetical protein